MPAGIDYSYYQTTHSSHHRIEIRQYWSVPVSALGELHNQAQWAALQSVVMVVSERRLWNKTTYKVRFYLSSDLLAMLKCKRVPSALTGK